MKRPLLDAEQRNWVSRAVAGDKDALGELLAYFGPDVEAALHISSTWSGLFDAADVMQITYLEAFLHIKRFDPARADAFPAWLRHCYVSRRTGGCWPACANIP